MDYNTFISREEYIKFREEVSSDRLAFAKFLADKNKKKDFNMDGFCEFCHKPTTFKVDWLYSDGIVPNYRERMLCQHCGLNNRQRFIAFLVRKQLEKEAGKTVYLYEQVTGFYKLIYSMYSKDHMIIGSEYLGHSKKKGEVVNGLRHEDALDLSFQNSSLDLVVSQDVLEHVPDYLKAIEESYRVLKKGGLFILSIPFHINRDITQQRAKLQDDNVLEYSLPPEYHGNPVDENGSLVFFDYGWDLLDHFKTIGFHDISLVSYWNYFSGHIGGTDQFIFIATKN